MISKLKQRSPNYPKIGLGEAIDRAKKIYEHAHRSPIDQMTAFTLMGYQGESGPSASTLSALKKFGLLEGRKDNLRLTELALRILEPMGESDHPGTFQNKRDPLRNLKMQKGPSEIFQNQKGGREVVAR